MFYYVWNLATLVELFKTVNDAAEGTIKFVSDFTNVIITNGTRWQAAMHEVEIQKIYSGAKKAVFFKIFVNCYWLCDMHISI